MQSFMQWLTQLCCDSLYPGAAHARCHFALHMLHIVLRAFKNDNLGHDTAMHRSCNSTGSKLSRGDGVQKKFRRDPGMPQQTPPCHENGPLKNFDPLAPCLQGSEGFVQAAFQFYIPLSTASHIPVSQSCSHTEIEC
jgi:hypothetical protein